MSTDYDAVCFTCQRAAHLGQRFTSGWAFAYGSNDAEGRRLIGDWLLLHLNEGHDVRVLDLEEVPEGFEHYDWTQQRIRPIASFVASAADPRHDVVAEIDRRLALHDARLKVMSAEGAGGYRLALEELRRALLARSG